MKNNQDQEFIGTTDATTQLQHKVTPMSATTYVAKLAILTAVSYILYMFVKFPLPFLFPVFLDIQISDLPALLGGFSMGPVAGCLIILAKCLLKMPFSGTSCVGELGDIFIGIAFVLTSSLVYKFYKNKKGAFWGLVFGSIACIIVSVIVNRFMLIPYYVIAMFDNAWEPLLGMVKPLYPNITVDSFYTYYLTLAVIPFNLLRCTLCGVTTFLVYKPLSKILHWEIK